MTLLLFLLLLKENSNETCCRNVSFFCIVFKYSTGISKLTAPAPLSHYTFFFT